MSLERIDKVEPKLVALGLVFCLELGLPLEYKTHVLVPILHFRTYGDYSTLKPVWALFDSVYLIICRLVIVVASDTNGPLLVDVITDGVVEVEFLTGLILCVVIFRVDVVHKLGGEFENRGRSGKSRRGRARRSSSSSRNLPDGPGCMYRWG